MLQVLERLYRLSTDPFHKDAEIDLVRNQLAEHLLMNFLCRTCIDLDYAKVIGKPNLYRLRLCQSYW